MTAHLDDDTLTALALGHRDAGAEGVADHLRVCPACAAALALAARTYVPASDVSRAKGAGAGTTDND